MILTMEDLLERFPTTTDGSILYPGMSVFYMDMGRKHRPVMCCVVKAVTATSFQDASGEIPYFLRNGKVPYFSNSDAAQNARAEYFLGLGEQTVRS